MSFRPLKAAAARRDDLLLVRERARRPLLLSLLRHLLLGAAIPAAGAAWAQETTTYTYDALGRLVRTTAQDGPVAGLQTATSFDSAGNRTNHSVSGAGGAGTVTLSVGAASATEGGTAVFTITKTGTATGSVSVSYATANGSAAAGADYTAASGVLTFLLAETSKTVSIATINDTAVESSETFALALSNPSAGAVVGTSPGIATIADNDSPPVPSFAIANAAAVTEGGILSYTVTKTGSTSSSFSVNYATANGTATAGIDYATDSGTLTFAAAETVKTVDVATIDDSAVEPDETVLVNLSSPTGGATIADNQGSGLIQNNDVPPPPPSFAITNAAAAAEGGTLSFTVIKTGSTSASFSVNYATDDGTATSGADYVAGSGTLTFAAAETTKTVSVATTDDTAFEADETVLVNLSLPSGGSTITTSQGSGTIQNNDAANTPPVANNDTLSMQACRTATKNVTANDTDADGDLPLTLISVTEASGNLTVSVASSSSVTVESSSVTGSYPVTYVIQDSRGATDGGNLQVTVTAAVCQ